MISSFSEKGEIDLLTVSPKMVNCMCTLSGAG